MKPLLELLDPRPLFDHAHLELVHFLASYYMAPLGEAYRSVIPGTARVESRRMFRLGRPPGALETATFTPLEHAIMQALAKRSMTSRQLVRLIRLTTLPDHEGIERVLARFVGDGLVESHEGVRGRHRKQTVPIVRLISSNGSAQMRGRRQREIIQRLSTSTASGVPLDQLEREIAGAKKAVHVMAERGVIELSDPESAARPGEIARNDDQPRVSAMPAPLQLELTLEQTAAVSAVTPCVRDRRFETFLLWGITASGKTEIYIRVASEALAMGRQVLVMVPEIALADQIVDAFRLRFGPLVAITHSAQNVVDRWASWMAGLSGDARIMIGPRSAVFAPIHDIGLIVVDEEHDPSYKQEEGIRYNARDLAVALGRFSRCPVILGSATPSAESYLNARRGRYKLLRLSHRIGERELASVEIIRLGQRPADGIEARPADKAEQPPHHGSVPLSPELAEALRRNLASRRQSLIFLNRRGYNNFLQCHLCGNVITCANCSVSMTFHLRNRTLRCHYCGASVAAPDKCPECHGFGLEGEGFGTERLVHVLTELVPGARIERMDSDTSRRRGARSALIERLRRGDIDILVGTQMITKGFDFPQVTLVGVILADLALNMPDFRSAERTFQLLTQVAGRAGRGDDPGHVMIQTYAPHHYSIRAARDQDYARFIRRELELRRELMYPPFARMALVRIEGTESASVGEVARRAAAVLVRIAKPDTLRVLGPAPAPIERIKRRYRWQVMVKATALRDMRAALATMRAETTPDAERVGVRIALDIDPVDML